MVIVGESECRWWLLDRDLVRDFERALDELLSGRKDIELE